MMDTQGLQVTYFALSFGVNDFGIALMISNTKDTALLSIVWFGAIKLEFVVGS